MKRSGRSFKPRRRGAQLVTAVVFAALLMTALADSAFAEANAVIPTSPEPGESATVINNYVSVPFDRNDDGSWPCGPSGVSGPAPCPGPEGQTEPEAYPFDFSINFFGTKYDGAFVNNNGNLTFTEPLSQFTPSSVTTFGSPIIAPFFADVDTRGEGSAIVNFGKGTLSGRKVFVVNWPGVGCFEANSSVLDNFQLILVDRADRNTGASGDDFDMEFNYNTVQWDTGQASGGGPSCLKESEPGSSAIVGYTNGTATEGDHFELPGSGVPNAFLDSSSATGLINHDLNSNTLGRYLFTVVNGQPTEPTTLETSLSGGGHAGAEITVPEGTAVTDNATLSGKNAPSATGTVTYRVYSDAECTTEVADAGTQNVTSGAVSPSSAETLAPGTYYWQASYSGDLSNNGSFSTCGSEIEIVEGPPPPPPCTKVVGSAKVVIRKEGETEQQKVENKLSTTLTSKQKLVFSWESGASKVKLTKLTSASCVVTSLKKKFVGQGEVTVNEEPGWHAKFYFVTTTKQAFTFHIRLSKPGEEPFAFTDKAANLTSETIS